MWISYLDRYRGDQQLVTQPSRILLLGLALAWTLGGAISVAQAAQWKGTSSERLVKLPPAYLAKTIDRDFAGSDLAAALTDIKAQIDNKTATLEDLQTAIAESDGALQIELRHQFLEEKSQYIKMLEQSRKYRAERAKTKIKIYQNLLAKSQSAGANLTPQKLALLQQQEQARARMERSISQVNAKVFTESMVPESKYSQEHLGNRLAIEKLDAQIKAHQMSRQSAIDQGAMSREDYIRQLSIEAEADLAIIRQEKELLSRMHKLVALDARALAENISSSDIDGPPATRPRNTVRDAVGFFVK